jgi:hypothetical protein
VDKAVAPELAGQYLGLIDYAISRGDEPLLRARGYLVAGILVQSIPDVALGVLDHTIKAVNADEAEVVKVASIKALQGFIKARTVPADRQVPIVTSISEFLYAKDLTDLEDADDLLVTLVESLRAAIGLDSMITISGDSGALDLLFLLAKHGASNFQLTMLVTETFEDVVGAMSGSEAYTVLCEKVLPSLTGAFDVGNVTEDNPLIEVSWNKLGRFSNSNPILACNGTPCGSHRKRFRATSSWIRCRWLAKIEPSVDGYDRGRYPSTWCRGNQVHAHA